MSFLTAAAAVAAACALALATPSPLLGQDLFAALGGIRTPGIQVTTDDRGLILRAREQGIITRPVVEVTEGGWPTTRAATPTPSTYRTSPS